MYLKSIALITYLAHVGCFVPADSCRVGLTDRIFTRIISHDSITSRVGGQSSFARDLNQVSLMANHATERSLCIVDEFGKGTKTSDGVGLLGGFLRYMSERWSLSRRIISSSSGGGGGGNSTMMIPPPPPKIFVATHFTDVADPSLVPRNANLRYLAMSVHTSTTTTTTTNDDDDDDDDERRRPRQQRRMLLERRDHHHHHHHRAEVEQASREEGAQEAEEVVTFLYKVIPGTSTRAYSLRCALEAGLPRAVLARIDELARLDESMSRRRDGVGGGGEEVMMMKPVAMSSAAMARAKRYDAIVESLAAVNLDDPRAVQTFVAAFCRGGELNSTSGE